MTSAALRRLALAGGLLVLQACSNDDAGPPAYDENERVIEIDDENLGEADPYFIDFQTGELIELTE
jgi:hypothetical protein